jgi:putative two-component system response regulator
MQVLLVDNNPETLMKLSEIVSELGHGVVVATNGIEGLAQYRKHNPRFVIANVTLEGMSGVELCRAIRRRQSMNYTYLILLTKVENDETVELSIDSGADDYLCETFSRDMLRLRLEAGKRLMTLGGRDMMIFSLAKLAECRDNDTGKHLDRMREYAKLLACELSTYPEFESVIDEQFIELLYLTSPLHDIGKVGIPDSVLTKPGKLTSDEFAVMKTHTVIGGETIRATAAAYPQASFLKMAMDVVMYHHERWDGTGYPEGLAGNNIPLSARIVALADVYDALTSKRVYKAAFDHESASKIIIDGRGTHFDPILVDAFLQVQDAMNAIRIGFGDFPQAMPTPIEPVSPAASIPQTMESEAANPSAISILEAGTSQNSSFMAQSI